MKTEIQKLINIAKIDTEIDILIERRETLPADLRDLESKLKGLHESLSQKKKEIEAFEQEKRAKELELTEKKDWLTQREAKAKELKTNKEYHAALKEVTQVKKTISDMETSLLNLASQIETVTQAYSTQEATYQSDKQALEQQITEKQNELNTLTAKIDEVVTTRTAEESQTSSPILRRYKTIKNRLSPAMAKTENGVCVECNTLIPPQVYIELQRLQQIITCPRCHRILYVE